MVAWKDITGQQAPKEIPEGWITAARYRVINGGNNQTLNRCLSETLIALIDEKMERDKCSVKEAVDALAETHIGIFITSSGQEVLAASPEGWREVRDRHEHIPEPRPGPVPSGWMTAAKYRKISGDNNVRLNGYLEDAVHDLVSERMKQDDIPAFKAADRVAETHVGLFTNPTGREVLAASPEGWAEIRRKHPGMKTPEGFER